MCELLKIMTKESRKPFDSIKTNEKLLRIVLLYLMMGLIISVW